MQPVLIGYFPKRIQMPSGPWIPSQVVQLGNAGRCDGLAPEHWTDLWLHNELWLYDTEARAWAVGTQIENDVVRAYALFADVALRGPRAGEASIRTASETLGNSTNLPARFSCQEYAKLLVAMARALGMDAWLVHVDLDEEG